MQVINETTRRDLLKLAVLAGFAVVLPQTGKAQEGQEGNIEHFQSDRPLSTVDA